jgi:hypothetical protein
MVMVVGYWQVRLGLPRRPTSFPRDAPPDSNARNHASTPAVNLASGSEVTQALASPARTCRFRGFQRRRASAFNPPPSLSAPTRTSTVAQTCRPLGTRAISPGFQPVSTRGYESKRIFPLPSHRRGQGEGVHFNLVNRPDFPH